MTLGVNGVSILQGMKSTRDSKQFFEACGFHIL